jgi:hypothetical protein
MAVGLVLMIVGVILILVNTGLIDQPPIRGLWGIGPIVLIGIGLYKLAESPDGHGRRTGFMFFMIGLWLAVSYFEVFGLSLGEAWPLLVVAVGINTIWKSFSRETRDLCMHQVHRS